MDGFLLAYDGFDPEAEGLREALTSTGNGYLCARGAAEWEDADGVHYPGTYVHGGYNRETTILGGLPVLNEDLVNLPNWLVLQLRIEGGDVIRLADVELLDYRHELDIRFVTVSRHLSFRDHQGRETTLHSRRFVSMADAHHGGIEWTLVPGNWSGRVEVVTAIDGRVSNAGVARYQQLEGRHLSPVGPRTLGPEVIALKTETRQSNLYVSYAARTRVFRGDRSVQVERRLYQMEDYIQQVLAFDVRQGEATRVEKLVTFFTSRDPAVSDTLVKAATSVARHTDFGASFGRHAAAWEELWRVCDVRVSGDDSVQLLLRLHIGHVLQVCSRNTADLDAGLPARGLNGEAYRGHVFWDELYAFPFFNVRLPEVTRGLLMYRYRRIGEARAAAREAGFRGAMFPWQSGSEGTEETQRVHLNPVSGGWEPDLSRTQRHVSAAIFWNIWQYFQTTHDQGFLRDYGAEMMLEITRFWASIAQFNPDRERYEIHGVMGPDEFHDKYPDAAGGGLRNNAYTNVMVAWLCDIAGQLLALLPASRAEELRGRLGIGDGELTVWRDISRRMFVPFHDEAIISQFEGYADLEELDWDALPREVRQHPAARPDPARGGQGPQPVQGHQAGRYGDAVLPVPGRRAPRDLRPARLRLRSGHGPAERRLLRPAHLARLDAELRHPRRGPRHHRPGQLVGAVPGRAAQRRRGHSGRHDKGRHPHGCHGGDARPRTAELRGHLYQRWRPVLRSPAAEPARRPLVLDAVPADPDPGHADPRPADTGPARRGREPFGAGGGPRRRPQAERGRQDRIRAQP